MGLWLGDGKSNDCIIYTGDKEIIEEVEKYAFSLGMQTTIYEEKANCVGIKIRKIYKQEGRENLLWQNFIQYDLVNNKHIPFDYLTNSEENRLSLLAGLIDSDGYLSDHHGYEITQINKRLAEEIKYLADTLGFRTNFIEKKTKCGLVEGIAYRVTINGDTWRIPCLLPRKQVKKDSVRKNKDFLLSQIKIEPIGEGEYAGFSLDGDHLFLLEDGTVTHNTEGIARALIILCRSRKLRIACFSELQTSIAESVLETLSNCISDMGLDAEFDIQKTTIICKRTGSEFIFSGLRYNINKIKSLARIDIAWIEEAVNVSKTSWTKLGPTIRGRHKEDKNGMGGPFGNGPEIWVSFNPELDDDETYIRFVLKKDKYAPDFIKDEETGEEVRYAIVKKVNWSDNKWFPDDLRFEMQVAKEADEVEYLNVWEGHTKVVLDGAIYAEEIKNILKEGRRGKVPYDPSRAVHTFWDLGHDDNTSIWFVQQVGVEYNIINYFEDRLKKIPYYLEQLQDLKYNYGFHYIPHDGDNETLAGRSVKKQIQDIYPGKVKVVPRVSAKVVGIRAARAIFSLCNFDEENTADGWQCLTRYQYEVDEETGAFSKEPLHNMYSHGADAFQTFALSLKSETATKKDKPKYAASRKMPHIGRNGWMG